MTSRSTGTLAERRHRDEASFVRRRRMLGVAVLVGVAATIAVLLLDPDPFAETRTVRIAVDDAIGTDLVGGEVRMAGTPVGAVTGRERRGDGAVLELELEESAGPVTRLARAEIRPRTPFEGPVFIALSPGPPSAAPLGDEVLPRERTRTYVQLGEGLRFARPAIREALRGSVGELREATKETGARGLRRAVHAAPRLTEELAPAARAARGVAGAELRSAIRGLATTAGAFARESDALVPLARGTARTFAALGTDGGRPLDRTVRELPARLAGLDAGGRRLGDLVGTLQDVGVDLRPTLREVVPTTDAMGPLLDEATPVLESTGPLVRDVRAAVAAGARAAGPGRELLLALRPSLSLLDDSLLPALEERTSLGLPTYLQFLSLFQGGGGASRGFQTSAQATPPSTGPGHFMRFNARFFTGVGYPVPACSALADGAPQLAEALAAHGGCTP